MASSPRGSRRTSASKSPNKSATAATRSSSLVVPTSPTSASGSRRGSLGVDASTYRYSLNVNGTPRFPTASTSGSKQILAREEKRRSSPDPRVGSRRASVASDTSSRVTSSRYTQEEDTPSRRAVIHTLPSDPAARGPWSKSGAQSPKPQNAAPTPAKKTSIMTSFPFPHPVTPRMRRTDSAESPKLHNRIALSKTWHRILNAIFAGPYERQLLREEEQDDLLTQTIIDGIATRTGTSQAANYGSISTPSKNKSLLSPTCHSSDDDADDPYGYRRMAGPHLLPSYSTDLASRRRERRRARSRARFHCMALWTISTVSILLLIIVLVCLFSFRYPDKLPLPGGSPDPDPDQLLFTLTPILLHLRLLIPGTIAQSTIA